MDKIRDILFRLEKLKEDIVSIKNTSSIVDNISKAELKLMLMLLELENKAKMEHTYAMEKEKGY